MFGTSIFNGERPDIALENGTLYGGLHCGDCFRYYENGWIDVRLELEGDEWLLICRNRRLPVRYGAPVII